MPDGYEARDYGQVALLLDGWTPDPVPSQRWRGVFPPNREAEPPAEPRGEKENPEVLVNWRLEYRSVDPTFEETGDPLRFGDLVLRSHSEIGSGSGIPQQLFGQLRQHIAEDEASEGLTWLPDNATPQVLGVRGSWWVEELRVPFVGG